MNKLRLFWMLTFKIALFPSQFCFHSNVLCINYVKCWCEKGKRGEIIRNHVKVSVKIISWSLVITCTRTSHPQTLPIVFSVQISRQFFFMPSKLLADPPHPSKMDGPLKEYRMIIITDGTLHSTVIILA